jgi:hypothetical protein
MHAQWERMMKTKAVWPAFLACIVVVMLTAAPAFAQQVTGVTGNFTGKAVWPALKLTTK